jgi:MFS family permease
VLKNTDPVRRNTLRNARLYFTGVTASTIGDSAMSLVAGIWVKTLTGSNGAAGLVSALVYLPSLGAPAAGMLADRVRRRPLLIWVNAGMAVLLPSLLLVEGTDRIWLVYVVMACYGSALTVSEPAENALFATMFDTGFRARLNGIRLSIQEGGRLLAPLAGAALFVVLGGGAVAVLDAVTFVVAAGLISRIRVHEPPPRPRTQPWRAESTAGLTHLWRTRELRGPVVAATVAMLASGLAFPAQYAMLDAVHRPPTFLGVTSALLGLGSLVAGLVSGPLIHRVGERGVAVVGLCDSVVAFALLCLPWLPAVLAGAFLRGFALPWIVVAAYTLTQRCTPDGLQGRTAAALGLLLFAPQPLAQLLGAGLIDTVDYRALFATSALTGLLGAVALVRRRPA